MHEARPDLNFCQQQATLRETNLPASRQWQTSLWGSAEELYNWRNVNHQVHHRKRLRRAQMLPTPNSTLHAGAQVMLPVPGRSLNLVAPGLACQQTPPSKQRAAEQAKPTVRTHVQIATLLTENRPVPYLPGLRSFEITPNAANHLGASCHYGLCICWKDCRLCLLVISEAAEHTCQTLFLAAQCCVGTQQSNQQAAALDGTG
jgi:hypothetical protein